MSVAINLNIDFVVDGGVKSRGRAQLALAPAQKFAPHTIHPLGTPRGESANTRPLTHTLTC